MSEPGASIGRQSSRPPRQSPRNVALGLSPLPSLPPCSTPTPLLGTHSWGQSPDSFLAFKSSGDG